MENMNSILKICDNNNISPQEKMKAMNSSLLPLLVRCAKAKSEYKKGGFRYESVLKLFATYIFIIGGRILYETLAANLPFPSVSTISRTINAYAASLVEGTCRVAELKTFLQARNLTPFVWLSEDATRITGRIQYDPNTNQLIGFVLPLDDNGMPVAFSFIATSAKVIQEHFTNNTAASSLYTIMAQPLQNDAPCFCLCIFGTDNKFRADHVMKRWDYMTSKLKDHGITVVGISSDGDSRLMKAMRIKTNIGIKSPNFQAIGDNLNIPEFHTKILPTFLCTQDTVHIGAKLKSRLLKPSIIMPLGNFVIAAGHLQILIDLVSKDKHLLTQSDLSSKDKMNFGSVIKICDPKIWTLLEKHVPGSEGTRAYLKMMFYVLHSYLSTALTIRDRIYYIWYSVFFLRLWRAWLKSIPEYSLTNNCITSNAYLCIEFNAHGLLNAIFRSIETNSLEHFLPWQYGSQQCESFFRNLRSTSTTCSTVVNCSLLDTIHRIQRIQLQADISVTDFNSEGENLVFPRTRHLNSSYDVQDKSISAPTGVLDINYMSPSYSSIKDILHRAKQDAFDMICTLGMQVDLQRANDIQIRNLNDDKTSDDDEFNKEDDEEENSNYTAMPTTNSAQQTAAEQFDTEVLQDLTVLSNITGKLELQDYSEAKIDLNRNSPFTVVKDSHGKEHVVRKSSICWLLSTNVSKLSSDRLQRVRTSEYEKNIRSTETHKYNGTITCEEVSIGDWCLFQRSDGDNCIIGLVLSFAYMRGSTWRSIEYSNTFANVSGNKKPIGVLCHWFNVDSNGNLTLLALAVHGYIAIEQYRLTLPPPIFTDIGLSLSNTIYCEIKQKL